MHITENNFGQTLAEKNSDAVILNPFDVKFFKYSIDRDVSQ